MKKLIGILLSVLLIISVVCSAPFMVSAVVEDSETVSASRGFTGGCNWTLDDNGTLTIKGNGWMMNYKDEDYITTAPWGTDIQSVVIENGVTNIGNSAFSGCTGLTNVTIPDSVTSIGSSAFNGCTGLTSVTIPDSVTSIGDSAFSYCYRLTSVNIPDSVTSIGDNAFTGCYRLTSVTIPDSVTSIGSAAFYDCTNLTSIDIPDIVMSIGDHAFYKTAWYNSQPDGLVYAGKVAYEYKGTMPSDTSIVLKDGTKGIRAYLFYCCTDLTSIDIPNSVTSIGEKAFYGCTGLKSVTIPGSVTSTGRSVFEGCTGLNSVAIGNGVTSISATVFHGCTRLSSIDIPDSVTSIGQNAFFNTAWYNNQPNGLVYAGKVAYKYKDTMPFSSIYIKDGTKGLAASVFENCTRMTSVDIPDSVTSIGAYAFSGCTGLTSVAIGNGVTSIGRDAFSGCRRLNVYINDVAAWCGIRFVNIDSNPLNNAYGLYLNNVRVTDLIIPDSVTSIGDYAFPGFFKLSITIPDSVTSIGKSAFDGYYNFKIYGYRDSAAESYANSHDIPFVELEKTVIIGDANGDNSIDVLDAAAIQKYASGKADLTPEQIAAADVNNDNNVDVLDAAEIQKFAAGKITEFK